MKSLTSIANRFIRADDITDIRPFGSGHINSSYKLDAGKKSYLLQRINHHVFPDVAALSNNIHLVTSHLRQQITSASGEAGKQQTLKLIATTNGALFCQDDDGAYWRMYDFLEGLVAYDVVETPEQAYGGARSFGFFLRFLTDFPVDKLVPVLPDFHNIVFRLKNFEEARTQVQGKLRERARHCQPEIKRIHKLADELTALQRAWQSGKLPTRVTHNDTKFNNVLLTPAGQGRAVIDLDTVMPGIVHFDYGDGIRTATASVAEDEADLNLLHIDAEKHRAFTEGYLSVTSDQLSPTELHYLPRSGALLAYLMAVRFLTDYFQGDIYYTIKYPQHNLIRARNQLRLAELLNAFGKR